MPVLGTQVEAKAPVEMNPKAVVAVLGNRVEAEARLKIAEYEA